MSNSNTKYPEAVEWGRRNTIMWLTMLVKCGAWKPNYTGSCIVLTQCTESRKENI